MAKTTRHGGDSYTAHELRDPDAPVKITRAVLGEVDRPSPVTDGGDSTQSSGSDSNSNSKPMPRRPSLAPTMANPSLATVKETSDAVSTDGAGRATTQPRSAKKVPAKRTAKKAVKKATGPARSHAIDEDFD